MGNRLVTKCYEKFRDYARGMLGGPRVDARTAKVQEDLYYAIEELWQEANQ